MFAGGIGDVGRGDGVDVPVTVPDRVHQTDRPLVVAQTDCRNAQRQTGQNRVQTVAGAQTTRSKPSEVGKHIVGVQVLDIPERSGKGDVPVVMAQQFDITSSPLTQQLHDVQNFFAYTGLFKERDVHEFGFADRQQHALRV